MTFFAKNIDSWFVSLIYVLSKNKNINVQPPSYNLKVGFKGCKSHGHVSNMLL